jgi:SAM-dependent methyltransferase
MSDISYQVYYREWHEDSPEHADRMAGDAASTLGPLVSGRKPGAVLDVGCGMGFALLGMKKLGFTDLSGVEVDQGQAESARKNGLAVECVANTAEFLQNGTVRYAIILLMDVLEHVPVAEQIQLLRVLHQRLEAGGRLIIQVPNANSVFSSRWRYNDHTHTSSFTEHSLRFCLLNAGFASCAIVKNDHLYRPSLRLWTAKARASWGGWLLERLWRSAFRHQFGAHEDMSKIPFGLNILAHADKGA